MAKSEWKLKTHRKNSDGSYSEANTTATIKLYPKRTVRGKKFEGRIYINTGWPSEYHLGGRSLESFAFNILKALKSKHLK